MKQAGRWWPRLLVVLLLIETGWLLYAPVRDAAIQVERDPIRHGRELAADMGCFTCHGPLGVGGVANPGSPLDTVPGFQEQTPMMFVHNDQEIREYILDGAPAGKLQRESYRNEMEGQAIRMPAYREYLQPADVDALVAYIRATSGLLLPDGPELARGEELMRKTGCFACHGEMGSGGMANPGSFKGYIPGFIGPDFAELVESDDELREWIRAGTLQRLARHPIASRFLDAQRIKMPAYQDYLSDWEIEAIVKYIRWLAAGSWRTQSLLPE
jgi:mono/diheme cytochrome c family protein